MFRGIVNFGREFADVYTRARLPRAAAALSYFLTMTFFPLLIVLYSLLGNSYSTAIRVLSFAAKFMAEDTVNIIKDFLYYVAVNHSTPMMLAGLSVILTSASAATRSIDATIADMQGGSRFNGARSFLLSIVFSIIFVISVYLAVTVMLTGRAIIARINALLPFVDISMTWNWLRFVLMFAMEWLMIYTVYYLARRKTEGYHLVWGTTVASIALVGDSVLFSAIIGASSRYPLLYGSLAAVILLMFWLYTCGLIIYCGAAVNIVLRNLKQR